MWTMEGAINITTYRLINLGKLKSAKVLGRRIITPEAVDAVLDEGA